MTISAVLFDLDGTLLDRNTSLRRFLAVQHAKRIAPRSTCPLELYQHLFLDWIKTVTCGRISFINN